MGDVAIAVIEPVVATVDDLDSEGRGVARVDGKVVFITGALPGERVTLRYLRRRRQFDEAVTVEVLDAAPNRVVPRCPHYDLCGGCSLQHLDADAQLEMKQTRLLDDLRHIGKIEPGVVGAPISGERWGYRRKARLGVRHVAKKGGALVGFREKRSNYVAELEGCEVLAPPAGELIAPLKALVTSLDARARIPQVEIAVGDHATALVFRHLDVLSGADRESLQRFSQDHGVCVYLQPGGPETTVLLATAGDALLGYSLADEDLAFHFSPIDFVQVNASVNSALVQRVLALLDPVAGETVLDLFCGLGNFTLPFARRAAHTVGIEGSAELVARAAENAYRNRVDAVDFHTRDLALPESVDPFLARGFHKLFLDPPRSGAACVVERLVPPYPHRLVYVSCNPATLARDAGVLVHRHRMRLLEAAVVDMFPHTNHVESIAVFEPASMR